MPVINNLSLRDTLGAGIEDRERSEVNALRKDAFRSRSEFDELRKDEFTAESERTATTFDEKQKRANTEWLAGASQFAMDNPDAIHVVIQKGQEKGIIAPDLDISNVPPERIQELLREINQNALADLGGPPKGDEIPSKVLVFEAFEKLGDPDNPDKRTPAQKRFLQVQRATTQFAEIGGAKGVLDKEDGTFTPVSTAEEEADAASDKAGQIESAKQRAIIAAIPAKIHAQYKAEFKAEAPKRIRAAQDLIARVDSVMEEANLALDDIDFTTTGMLGSVARKIAGTKAFALARKIETIQANLSFDRIAEMRKNSPTGGALGQVSNIELTLLGAAVVALNQANSEEEVRRAFEKVLFHYNRWKGVVTGRIDADQLLLEGVTTPGSEQATEQSQSNQVSQQGSGDVFRNEQTGQRIIWQNGQWVDVTPGGQQ